jgi:uncharacterized GH25 family protein
MRYAGIVILGLTVLPGCGGPSMAQVKGVVTCKGKPVAEAYVTFSPIPKNADDKHPGKPATGFTDAQGVYELSTYRNYDGAQVGSHKVNVGLDDTNPARCKRVTEKTFEVKSGSNVFDITLDEK